MSVVRESTKVFAENMKHRRKELGISQEKLGEMCKLHRTYIGGIEQYNRNPSLESMKRIADALSISVSLLMSENYKQFEGEYTLCVHEDDDYEFYPIDPSELKPEVKKFLDNLTK